MSQEVKLAEPGAGLPWLELQVGRFLFSRMRKRESREDFDRRSREARKEIVRTVEACPAECRGERVLIRRLPGLEDSSRNWSVWMTLDHLRICNEVFTGVIAGLVRGEVPERVADTAAVKPSPQVGAEAEEAFGRSCEEFVETVSALPDLTIGARYAHPWFGPLDAAGWQALAAVHMELHRKQLARIFAGLEA